ncbi:hypothetical protein [Aquisalimonas asiatica]|nr:hypothetical protein [Aquisalimonas asiatica]
MSANVTPSGECPLALMPSLRARGNGAQRGGEQRHGHRATLW